jgi:HlyD family secretion protein
MLVKSNKTKKRVLWIVGTVVFVAAIVLAGGWFMRQRARADTELEPNQVVTAFIGELAAEASASGQLLPQQEAALAMSIAGRVEQVYVEAGDKVAAGDALIQLENNALQRAVRQAEQALTIQEARLAELREGAAEEDLDAATAAVASAQVQLDDLLAGPSEEELADAQAALASAQAQLDDLLAGPKAKELASARAALVSAQVAQTATASRYTLIDNQLLVARQQLAHAEITLESARYFYDALANDWQHKDYAPFSPEAETLKDAQTAYQVALARYNLVVADINDSAYRNTQAQVAQAENSLALLTEEKTVPIAAAREQLAAANAQLAALTEEKTVQLASARAQLAQAEANMENLLDGASEEQIKIAEAQVEQTRIALENARARLADAALTAPFDGVVTAVHIDVGEWATGLAVELVDTNSLEVVLDVDEVDIGTVALGQPTIVTLEPWPERELSGEVTAIAPKAQAQSEIVTYQVHITLDAQELPIRTGMTANAELTTAERKDVLLVPNRAIIADRQANKYYVNKVDGETITKVEVTIGLRDSIHTEITSGLGSGDKISIAEEEEQLEFGPPH